MFKTRITELLGIEYPIVQGGMVHLSRAELVAAVSNAGGLGIITSADHATKEGLRDELRRTKSLTDKPFGVNINLSPAARPVNTEEYIDVVIEEGVRIVETSGRSPEPYMKQFKQGNVIVIHKAPGGVRFAETAELVGCDAVSIIGYECGGHPGPDDTGSLVLVPATVAAVKIPVIAGGGFADAGGFVSALALGADGVLMGTRFMATRECPAHPKYKEWLLNSRETDTLITQRSIRAPSRNLRNGPALKVQEMESRGATLEELLTVTSGQNSTRAYFDGELEAGLVECGQVVGLIHDIPTVKEVIDGIITGAREIIEKRLTGLVAGA
ncbi:MAG TPA: nitronate monooxygenase [Dehalococcoidales bacterium]|nr:nitronate monooxygenase [Dehalococcoidales bacterium]